MIHRERLENDIAGTHLLTLLRTQHAHNVHVKLCNRRYVRRVTYLRS